MMPEWIDPTIAALVTAVCTAVAVIGWLVSKILPVVRRFTRFLDDVQGEPARPGVPATPGIMERLAELKAQVIPNHGSSIRDAVDRIETASREILVRIESVEVRVGKSEREALGQKKQMTNLGRKFTQHLKDSAEIRQKVFLLEQRAVLDRKEVED